MLGGLAITQSSKRNLTASGRRFGRVNREAVESTPLLCLRIREQCIRFCQFSGIDRFLRLSFEGYDFGIVAWQSRCRFSKAFEALCDFDKLSSQPLRGNVILAKNTQRRAHLAFIEG